MKKQYEFAGVEIAVTLPEDVEFKENRHLKEFYTEQVMDPYQFILQMKEKLTEPIGVLETTYPNHCVYRTETGTIRYIGSVQQSWGNGYIRVDSEGKVHIVELKASEYKGSIGGKAILNAIGAEHLVLEKHGVILHASFIEHEGKAILFTAPSETGKSTQADLWMKHREAEIINGDRAVIRLIDGKSYACGIPFAGSSQYCKNATLPLEAIVYLGQAPETSIRKMNFAQAFTRVWEGCTVNTWNQEDLNKAIDIVQQITMQTPAYHLQCTPDESAIIALESELDKL